MSLKSDVAQTLLVPLWRLRAQLLGRRAMSRVLMYHAIGTAVPEDLQGRYTLSAQRFAQQMARLATSGLPVVPVSGVAEGVSISFDDGYRDNLTAALPVLERHGFPFTIFVATGFARSGNPIYLSAAEIKTLANHPLVSIGAHGDSHRRLTGLTDVELAAELTGAKAWLENVTGKPVTSMSYPHGAVDARVRDVVAVAGYARACTSEFGANQVGVGDRAGGRAETSADGSAAVANAEGVNQPSRGRVDLNALALRRIDIWSSDDEATFEAKLAGDWDWMRFFTRCGL